MNKGITSGRLAPSRAISAALGLLLFGTAGCSKKVTGEVVPDANLVRAGDLNLVRNIGDENFQFTIMGRDAVRAGVRTRELIGSADTSSSLVFGLPMKMLGTPMIFGSVVTKVSDGTSEDLGGLKMADLPPFEVIPRLTHSADGKDSVTLLDCEGHCDGATANLKTLIDIPVTAIDQRKKVVYLDLASLGSGLDLKAIRKGDPTLAHFTSKSSDTVTFDYSQSTLVFDVEAHLVADAQGEESDTDTQDADDNDDEPTVSSAAPMAEGSELVITNRWYLKSIQGFNPRFASRKATPGVGFFMTENSSTPLVQRWDFDQKRFSDGIKYYVKNVPAEYQDIFGGAFEEWNKTLLPIIGKKVFTYEFLTPNDPRNEQIISGDVRYNVLEWDLVNKAPYGGLGPSLARPSTGETFHANVLIQGPHVIDLYSRWFKASQNAKRLRRLGRGMDAESVLMKADQDIRKELNRLASRKFQLSFAGGHLLRIHSQQESTLDPLMSKEGFDEVPAGYTFARYMAGYFHDMVTHELGHNLGLRHNFKGNLGAHEDEKEGKVVSRSVMEYLGRGYRYLDHVGDYDLMAIAYGYRGVKPAHLDWFCTDDDVANLHDPSKSAECSRSDATADPFSYFQSRVTRAAELLVAKGKTSAPDWEISDLKDELRTALVGLGTYAVSAADTSATWTNFFIEGRPTSPAGIRSYVLSQIKSELCNPTIEREIDLKRTEEGRVKAATNLTELRAKASAILEPVFSSEELACGRHIFLN